MVLELEGAWESPGGFLRHSLQVIPPGVFGSVGLREDGRICISNKFPGDAAAATVHSEVPFWEYFNSQSGDVEVYTDTMRRYLFKRPFRNISYILYIYGYISVFLVCVLFLLFNHPVQKSEPGASTFIILSHLASLGKTFPHSFNHWHKRIGLSS